MRVLVTGGSGYIGSHTFLSLLQRQHEVFAIDNYANSSPITYERIKQLSNQTVSFADVIIQTNKHLPPFLTTLPQRPSSILLVSKRWADLKKNRFFIMRKT